MIGRLIDNENDLKLQFSTLEQFQLLALWSAHQSKLKAALRAGKRSVCDCAQGNSTSLESSCGECGHTSDVGGKCQKCEERRGCLVSGRGHKCIAGDRCRGGSALSGGTGVLKQGGGLVAVYSPRSQS